MNSVLVRFSAFKNRKNRGKLDKLPNVPRYLPKYRIWPMNHSPTAAHVRNPSLFSTSHFPAEQRAALTVNSSGCPPASPPRLVVVPRVAKERRSPPLDSRGVEYGHHSPCRAPSPAPPPPTHQAASRSTIHHHQSTSHHLSLLDRLSAAAPPTALQQQVKVSYLLHDRPPPASRSSPPWRMR
jgi:hypothetical protein